MKQKEIRNIILKMNKKEKIKLLLDMFDRAIDEKDEKFCDYFIKNVSSKLAKIK